MSTTSTGMKAGAEADASMAIHLASSAPKGGSIMVTMPNSVMTATRGMILYRPRMDSMSREPMCCSDGAHAEEEEALGNRVEDDEQDGGGDGRRGRHAGARDDEPGGWRWWSRRGSFLPLLWPQARAEAATKVKAPVRETMPASMVPAKAGERRSTR